MFNSLFNVIIVLIPLAIFIGRAVSQARRRHAPPPPPTRIPVAFEDDDYYEEDDYVKPAPKPLPKPAMPFVAPRTDIPPPAKVNTTPAPAAPQPEKKDSPLNLNHLSPMKQAVVMAEVLGPPKALTS